jgi:hypothetical protein
MFRRVIVATVTMFFQQWTGINAILYYAPKIFKGLGLSSNTVSLLATGVVGIAMYVKSKGKLCGCCLILRARSFSERSGRDLCLRQSYMALPYP